MKWLALSFVAILAARVLYEQVGERHDRTRVRQPGQRPFHIWWYMRENVGIACANIQPALHRTGVLRLLGNPGAGRPFGLAFLSPAEQRELWFLSNNPSTAQTEGEGCVLDESMAEVRAAGNFGNRPLRVLASSRPFQSPGLQYVQATGALTR